MPAEVDVVVIGAGIIGLATTYALLQKNPALRIQVIEKEKDVALHQTGRNSGVVHSGVYYKPGSLKAQNCREGRKALLQFCEERGIAYEHLSKLIVAIKEEDKAQLAEIQKRGHANGVEGLELLTRERMQEIEPHVEGLCALHVPHCHIVHFPSVAKELAALIQQMGAEILFGHQVNAIQEKKHLSIIETQTSTIMAKAVINCAGLFCDRIARMTGKQYPLKIIPFRGEYYEIVPEKRHLVKGLVYPVPDPRFPFLGVHLTRMMDGKVEAGPNAVLALAREGYKKSDADLRDCLDFLGYKGFWMMALRYWNAGFYEMARSFSKNIFVQDVQKLMPVLKADDLKPGGSGVRAQVITKEGKLLDDFALHREGRILHVLSAPSPAATASFAIGGQIADIYFKEMCHA